MRRLGLLYFALLLGGCVTPSATPSSSAGDEQPGSSPQVVVAVVDTGINPWHGAFTLSKSQKPPNLPVPIETIPLSFRQRLAEEGLSAWNTLKPGQLYWFEGTRVLAVSRLGTFTDPIPFEETLFPPDPHLVYDDVDHGTAVASVVARTSPHAWILMVETDALNLDAYRWVAQQAWVDVISSSQGTVAHVPHNLTEGGRDQWAIAFHEAVLAGKLFVQAGGNQPDPGLLAAESAPWLIVVGGADPDARGPTPITSQPVDVVAQFTWDGLAGNRSEDDTFSGQGTSFGAPLVAGALAEALYRLRLQAGHEGGITDGALVATPTLRLTNVDFRWALNMTARYWDTTDYDARVNTSRHPLLSAYGVANPSVPRLPGTPVGPWVQMGWGYVDGATWAGMVALLTGEAEPPDKQDAAAYLERLFELRATMWDLWQRD